MLPQYTVILGFSGSPPDRVSVHHSPRTRKEIAVVDVIGGFGGAETVYPTEIGGPR